MDFQDRCAILLALGEIHIKYLKNNAYDNITKYVTHVERPAFAFASTSRLPVQPPTRFA